MDEQLRKLERAAASGDREAGLRLGQYQCKLEGHLDVNIKEMLYSYDPIHLNTRFQFITETGARFDVKLPDTAVLRLATGQRIERFLRETRLAMRHLSLCPRCREPLGEVTYNKLLEQATKELAKVLR